jgi:hypothetical protein
VNTCPSCHQPYDEANGHGTRPSCEHAAGPAVSRESREHLEGTTPPDQEAQLYRVATRLLTGGQAAPPAAWQLRRDLVKRTWAWPVAQDLLINQERRRHEKTSTEASPAGPRRPV